MSVGDDFHGAEKAAERQPHETATEYELRHVSERLRVRTDLLRRIRIGMSYTTLYLMKDEIDKELARGE